MQFSGINYSHCTTITSLFSKFSSLQTGLIGLSAPSWVSVVYTFVTEARYVGSDAAVLRTQQLQGWESSGVIHPLKASGKWGIFFRKMHLEKRTQHSGSPWSPSIKLSATLNSQGTDKHHSCPLSPAIYDIYLWSWPHYPTEPRISRHCSASPHLRDFFVIYVYF